MLDKFWPKCRVEEDTTINLSAKLRRKQREMARIEKMRKNKNCED